MKKISTCLWFDDRAEEAVNLYSSIFKNSKIEATSRYGEAAAEVSGRPKGSVMVVTFQLDGEEFMALNGGPVFTFSPAISFFVSCKTEEEVDSLFQKLSAGGLVLMELAKYPFSEKFAWVNDRFGASWQLCLGNRPQKITPLLMFVGEQQGKAEEAMKFYISQFENSRIINIKHYEAGEMEPEGTVKHAVFSLNGQEFMAMDSNGAHPFTFTPATSFVANCETQGEVDTLWKKLSDGGRTDRCGWLTDKYGVSWQIVPTVLSEIMQAKDTEKSKRVMEALLQMDKLDIEALRRA
jgi:predicted 3-demethylubiquinone-9 3-methyltransferase (glyoxalase superfamily)